MSTYLTLEQWLGEQAVPLVFIGFALLMGILLLYFSALSRRASLVRDRSGKNENTFAEYLAAYGFDPEIARARFHPETKGSGEQRPVADRDSHPSVQRRPQTVLRAIEEQARQAVQGRESQRFEREQLLAKRAPQANARARLKHGS